MVHTNKPSDHQVNPSQESSSSAMSDVNFNFFVYIFKFNFLYRVGNNILLKDLKNIY